MRKLIVSLVVMVVMAVPLCAELPDMFFGAAYDSEVKLTTMGAADVFGKYGFAVCVGAVEKRGPMIGLDCDLGALVKRIGLDYLYENRVVIKLVGYGSYDMSEENWSGGMGGAAISVTP